MSKKECIAMILAGGRGKRLGALTHYFSKPAVYFGGNYRIIDFTLNNCRNSEIDTVGILSQYFTVDLNEYINSVYENREGERGIHLLLPGNFNSVYRGTADAVYQNIAFIDQFNPKYVLILASDHVYNMDYKRMIAFHKEKDADITVASIPVHIEDASKFGILNAKENGRVLEFEEKPSLPKSNLASMGIYVFKWDFLKRYFLKNSKQEKSQYDFGKDILPEMLSESRFYTYRFNGYWRDVGTVQKLWEANMDQINDPSILRFPDNKYYGQDFPESLKPKFIAAEAVISQSILSGECLISGNVKHSVLGNSVTVETGAEVINSVVMPNVYIGKNVKIHNAVIGTHSAIMDNSIIGSDYGEDFFIDRHICRGGVSLVAPWLRIPKNIKIRKNSQICKERLNDFYFSSKKSTVQQYGNVPGGKYE